MGHSLTLINDSCAAVFGGDAEVSRDTAEIVLRHTRDRAEIVLRHSRDAAERHSDELHLLSALPQVYAKPRPRARGQIDADGTEPTPNLLRTYSELI